MAFLRRVNKSYKLDRIKNRVIREGLQVLNLNERLQDNKLPWKNTLKECQFQDWPNESENINPLRQMCG